jgi:hypothetical protein
LSRIPRLTPSKLIALCLLLAGAGALARAQSLSGIKAPDESTSAVKQQVSAKLRAERGQAPLGQLYEFVRVDQSKIRALRAPAPQELRGEDERPGKQVRVGVIRAFPQPLEVERDGALYRVAEGEARVLGLRSEGALMTRVHFTNMRLPKGARVFVYSLKNPEEFYGPYEGRGPAGDGAFWSPPVEGDGAVVEYFNPDPAAASEPSPFQVSEVSHIYRDPLSKATAQDAAGACNREVTSEWATVAKSVGLLQFTKGTGEYLCTGTLLNNQNNDFKPYLLTAGHCFSAPSEAQTLRVYWNFNSGDVPATSTPHTDGASLLATGNESDFTFVLLSGTLPSGLFFSGWEVTPTPLASSVTGIHHPEGSHKRIAFGNTVAHNTAGLPGPSQNFTGVRWNSGITEPGSSGSGIWTGSPSSAKLVGTLTGGAAACDNTSGVDFYGSFSVTYPRISSFLAKDTTPDDTLEQNDTRPAARALANGTYRNLVVKAADEDWYKLSVPAGSAAGFRVDAQTAGSSIVIAMYRGSGTEAVGTNYFGNTVTDRNTTSGAVDYYLRVSLPATAKPTTYTLYVAGGGAACAAAPTPISIGQTLTGTLSTSDCATATPLHNVPGTFYMDRYTFYGKQGQELKVTYTPTNPLYNTYLVVRDPTGYAHYADAPGNATQGSTDGGRILYSTGTYTIEVSSGTPEATGSYSVRLADARWNTVTIGKGDYFVDEGAGHVAIPVSIGPTTEGGATVEYTTSDAAGSKGCGEANPAASSRCDYVTMAGTLRFAQGETSKTIYVPLINDAYGEAEETFTLTLRNSRSASIGTYSTTKIHISANDGAGTTPTPIDETAFFVRQHYLDFLGREPDPAGYAAWQDILNKCAAGDTKCDRIEVSSAFFRSTEFQGRAYFIYRFYRAALARIPTYAYFIPDMSKVSGFLTDAQLETNKAAFAAEFVTRPEFAAKYDALTTATAYVNALVTAAGVTLPNKQALIDDLTAKRKDRAQVLRAVVESAEVYNKFYDEAFVVMQYHGYLRRDPDILYLDWIETMKETGGDYRTMINGFMNSGEYRERFGLR